MTIIFTVENMPVKYTSVVVISILHVLALFIVANVYMFCVIVPPSFVLLFDAPLLLYGVIDTV